MIASALDERRRQVMKDLIGLDVQDALVLAVGWVTALWATLT
jgi:hypothetical protein